MAKRSEKTVLFLCTGNYYRSRFAEVLTTGVSVSVRECPFETRHGRHGRNSAE